MKQSLAVFFFWLTCAAAYGQTVVSGYVHDAATGEVLPAANVQIEGTYRGTITNREGEYVLTVHSFPAVLIVRYIGYETKRVTLTEPSAGAQDISLTPSPIEFQGVVITGEDPGVLLMRNVIRKKQQWHKKLAGFKADAYSRVVLENDSGIVMISESLGDIFWDRVKGIRAVIRSKRSTKNVDPKDMVFNPEAAVLNFYDDEVEVQGSRFIGPTHPDALDYYEFTLIGQRTMNGDQVYDIRVKSRSKLQPTFAGTVSVLDKDSVLIGVNLRPSESSVFPVPIREWGVAYEQQFSNFGREFWLPVDVRVNGQIKIGLPGLEFPSVRYSQISALNNYVVNEPLPDSLYKKKAQVIVDSVSLAREGGFDSIKVMVPLLAREDSAYAEIKRGDSFGKAFKPTGLLARFVKVEDEYNDSLAAEQAKPKGAFRRFVGDLSPQLGYNRVEGGRLGAKYEHEFNKRWKAYLRGGYTTALKDPFYGAGGEFRRGANPRFSLRLSFYDGVETRFASDHYEPSVAALGTLLGGRDYFDYYRFRQVRGTVGFHFPTPNVKLEAAFINDRQRSVAKTTDWSVFNARNDKRANPSIDEGMLRAMVVRVQYGDDDVPFGVVGVRNVSLAVEHSPNLLSDFDYTTYRATLNWRFNTFLRRRFLANTLDVRAVGGTYSGRLPIQKLAVLDGSIDEFTPFGVFKTLRTRAYEGERYAAVFWEHNFRTVPFELLGLRWLVKRSIGILVFGGHGRTWIRPSRLAQLGYTPAYTNRLHHELGGSINGIFGLFRFDFARRLDRPGLFLGLSMAKLF